jgi:protein kinase
VVSKLGSGAFGSVEKAENRENREIVAIKKLKRKYSTWDECLQLPEVKALRKLMHPNIIKLKELIRHNTEAYFVFEYIDRDVYKLTQSLKEKGKQLTEAEIKNIAWQVAQALCYIHKQGFFHRDLKPENLLIAQDNTVKLIDFGLAKEIRSKPPFTEYVSTRWYRAPEILLRSSTYSAPVDVFAFGCVLAELYLMKPLFSGTSEIDQLSKICSVMGTPTQQDWPEGLKLAALKGYNFPQYQPIPLGTVLPNCSSEGLNLIGECLKFDPFKRITMAQVLTHPYFKGFKF